MTALTYVIQGLLAFIFFVAGVGKVTGTEMHVKNCERWRLPNWFMFVTGAVELAGSFLLVLGFWSVKAAIAGAIVLGVTGIGGVITHMRVKDPFKETVTILVLAILSFVLLYLYLQ